MKRTKRVLSLIICMLLAITSLPVTQLVAFGDATAEGVVSVNKTFNYADVNQATVDGWSAGTEDHAKFTVEDGVPTLRQFKQTVVKSGKVLSDPTTKMIYKLPAGPVSVDVENRTRIINEDGKYTGTVKIDIDAQLELSPKEAYTYVASSTKSYTVKVGYANMNFYGGDIQAVNWRISPGGTQAMSSDSAKNNTIKRPDGENGLGGSPAEGILMSTTIDTVNETVKAAVSETQSAGDTWAKTKETGDLLYVDTITLAQMKRMDVDSYSKVKSIKVTTLDPKFDSSVTEKLNSFPNVLNVADINNVTEDQINLPEIDGVVWSAASENVSVEGNVAKLSRVKNQKVDVVIKGTFVVDEITYSKEYTMTLAEGGHIVKYYDDNGQFISSSEIKDGQCATAISAPSKENYAFIGWFEADADNKFDFTKPVTEDLNLYAKYEGEPVTVELKVDGITKFVLNAKFGECVTDEIPDVPKKDGYTSVGWFVGDSDEPFTKESIINKTDMVVNARYEEDTVNVYTVTFNVDGSEYATKEVVDGYVLTDIPNDPVKANYTFGGWTLNGATFDFATEITANIILDAKFEPVEFEVKFYMDDTMSELYTTGKAYYNTAYGTLPVPSKPSFKFKGWKNADGTEFTSTQIITTSISVYAVWEDNGPKVVLNEDITKYNGSADELVRFVDLSSSSIYNGFNKGYVSSATASDTSNRTNSNFLTGTVRVPVGEFDSVNRTQFNNLNLVGDYEIELTFDLKETGAYTTEGGTSVNAPYGYVSTGHYSNNVFAPILYNRVNSGSIQSFNSTSTGTNSFNSTNKTGKSEKYTYENIIDGVATDVVLRIRYDTVKDLAYMSMDGSDIVAWGNAGKAASAINGFNFKMMGSIKVGDFVKIKNVRVTQYNDYSELADYQKIQNILDQLPVSVVNDPYDAKGIVNLPKIEGVIWSSSDERYVSSETGIISPLYDDIEVQVIATISCDGYLFEKVYTLTVKADKSINKQEIIKETFKTEDDLTNWTFANHSSDVIGGYSVDENGVKVIKIKDATEPDKTYETKRYFAFYDLYKEVSSDEYTVTEVKDHKGIYDITVDYSKYSASSLPMNIAVGYRNGSTFYDHCMLKVNKDGTNFCYQMNGEPVGYIPVVADENSTITMRVDLNKNEISLFVDGNIVADRCVYEPVLGNKALINSVKIELDENSLRGDYIAVKGISVTKVVEKQFPELENIINASNELDVYDITLTPGSVSGKINKLPEKIGEYDVNWSSSSEQINLATGKVYHDVIANEVYLYAEIYDADSEVPLFVRKTFKLNIREGTDSEIGELKLKNIGEITNQNYNDIRYDLNIPQVEGVVWTSSNTSIISNDGKLNSNITVTEKTPVTVTATSGNASRDYKLIVSPYTPFETVATGIDSVTVNVGNIANAKLSDDVRVSFKYTKGQNGKVNITDDKGNVILSLVSGADGFYFDYTGSDYARNTSDSAEITIITMQDVKKAAIFVDGKMVADYVPFKTETDCFAKVDSEISIGEIKVSMDKYGILQSNIDNHDYFGNVIKGYADSNGLVISKVALTNAVVDWKSSDTSVLKDDGTVITPLTMKTVNLTFSITDKANNNVSIKKNFEIAVDCDNSKNIIYNNVPQVEFKDPKFHQDNLTDASVSTIFKVLKTNSSDCDIVFNLGKAKTFNSMFVLQANTGMEDFEIYSSNDGSVWNKLASGNMEGKFSKHIKFNNTTATYVKFVVKKCGVNEVDISEIKLFLSGTDLELAQYDMELLTIDTAPNGTSINLPTTGVNGTAFVWESSNTGVISTTGAITKPQTATTVTLTAKANVGGQTLTKSFDVYVDVTSINGPTQVGGGAGGGGGGGASSNNVDKTPIIGATDEDVYAEDIPSDTTVSTGSYKDVKETDWYSKAVNLLTEKGIVSGDGTGNFNPHSNVTREQFVKMILEALEIEINVSENPFTDVAEGTWYEKYVATAHSLNIINGLAATHFGVGTNITRQDMAVLIERVLNVKGIELTKNEAEPFADASEVSAYASDAVANMKAIGLIQGYNNNYNPKDNLTRAEAATVIASLLELLAK